MKRRSASYGELNVDQLPKIEGECLVDPSVRSEFAQDAGNIVHRTPGVVVRPTRIDDLQAIVRHCCARSISVAARGQGHTTHGQSLVEGGVVVDMSALSRIHAIGPAGADVEAGAKWSDVTARALDGGLVPPVLTGYLGLSVGGTLSVGGISSTNSRGAQVDRVRELQVVTGDGELVWCSESAERELFDAVLAGIGQFGVIVRAKLDLIPAPAMARMYFIEHQSADGLFADLKTLLRRAECEDVYDSATCVGSGRWVHHLTATTFFGPDQAPDDQYLLRDLVAPRSSVQSVDMTYRDYVFRVDAEIAEYRAKGMWDRVAHPWFDVFLPEGAMEEYLGQVLPTLGQEDLGSTGFLLLFPQRRDRLRRPMLSVPSEDEWIYLFDLLTAAPGPGRDDAFRDHMLARNRRMFDLSVLHGGTRYPIGSLESSEDDWRRHYGERWARVVELKRRYDPSNILAPGVGIFSQETQNRA